MGSSAHSHSEETLPWTSSWARLESTLSGPLTPESSNRSSSKIMVKLRCKRGRLELAEKGCSGSSAPNSGTTKSAAWPAPTGAPMGRSRSPRCYGHDQDVQRPAKPDRSTLRFELRPSGISLPVIIREGARHLHPGRRQRSEDVLDVRARFDPRRNESGECKTNSPPEAQPALSAAWSRGPARRSPPNARHTKLFNSSSCSFSASSLTSCPAVRKRCTDRHTSAHARPKVSSVAGSFTSAEAECKTEGSRQAPNPQRRPKRRNRRWAHPLGKFG